MNNPPRERPVKDERDKMIDRDAKNWSLELMICATQVMTLICAVKGNAAWKGACRCCSSAWLPRCCISTALTGRGHTSVSGLPHSPPALR